MHELASVKRWAFRRCVRRCVGWPYSEIHNRLRAKPALTSKIKTISALPTCWHRACVQFGEQIHDLPELERNTNETRLGEDHQVKIKKLVSGLAAAGLGLALTTTSATAAITWFFPITAFQDDNIDFVSDTNSNGVIDVGDRLISAIEFVNTQGILPGQGPNPIQPPELTGVADITVVAIAPNGSLIFRASNENPLNPGVLAGFATGTAVALWTDASPDLNVINATCGTRAQCLALAGLGETDGSTLWATAGFFGDPDEFWVSNPLQGGTSIATVQNGGSSSKFADFNFSLSLGENNTGRTFGEQPCAPFCNPLAVGGDGMVDVAGSGDILGGQGLTPVQWTARSDADFQLVPLPQPGSLALLGLALAAAGFVQLRRKTVS